MHFSLEVAGRGCCWLADAMCVGWLERVHEDKTQLCFVLITRMPVYHKFKRQIIEVIMKTDEAVVTLWHSEPPIKKNATVWIMVGPLIPFWQNPWMLQNSYSSVFSFLSICSYDVMKRDIWSFLSLSHFFQLKKISFAATIQRNGLWKATSVEILLYFVFTSSLNAKPQGRPTLVINQ